MRDQYIFDIPIYRKTEDDFNAEINILVAKRIEWIMSHDEERRPLAQEVHDRVLHSEIQKAGGPWQFNQIVGWFRLFAEGCTIGCHPWWVDAKRLSRKMQNKRMYLKTYSDILHARFSEESSTEIYIKLIERLIILAKEPKYKNRYVDLNVFYRIGPYIDWRAILEGTAKQNKK